MILQLRLNPDDAPRLPRLKLLAAARRGRAHPQRIVWYDTPQATLTAKGLCLAKERNSWRLERLVPEEGSPWPPGGPPPVLAEAPDFSALGHEIPSPLAPAVAFIGRQQTYDIELTQGRVILAMRRGTLRGVTTESVTSRLELVGDDQAVLQLALALAKELQLDIPNTTLAGEALASSRSTAPVPRRLGVPHVREGLTIPDAFAFVLGHLTDVMMYFAEAAAADLSGPEPVHQMRVALRRLRTVVTIFQPMLECPELRGVKAALITLSAKLGPTRDWDVFLGETTAAVTAAFPNHAQLARLITSCERRRSECHSALRVFLHSGEYRRLVIELAWLAGARSWAQVSGENREQPTSLEKFAENVLSRRFRKLLAVDDLIRLDLPMLHIVRLKAKRVRYAAELFGPLYSGKGPKRFIRRLAAVQDGLGQLNDAATAYNLLARLGGARGRHAYATGLVLGFVAAGTAGNVMPNVIRRWRRFLRTGPFWE